MIECWRKNCNDCKSWTATRLISPSGSPTKLWSRMYSYKLLLSCSVTKHYAITHDRYDVLAKHKAVQDPHHVRTASRVFGRDVLQDPHLHSCLMVKSLLIPQHLQRHRLSALVIETLQHLSKAALAQQVEDLVAIANVLSTDCLVIALVVVVPTGERGLSDRVVIVRQYRPTHEVDFSELMQLLLLLLVKLLSKGSQGLCGRQRVLCLPLGPGALFPQSSPQSTRLPGCSTHKLAERLVHSPLVLGRACGV